MKYVRFDYSPTETKDHRHYVAVYRIPDDEYFSGMDEHDAEMVTDGPVYWIPVEYSHGENRYVRSSDMPSDWVW